MNQPLGEKQRLAAGLVLLTVALLGGCAIVPQGHGDYDAGLKGRGAASWYGDGFHGRLTANGQIYDQYKFTAAHRSLPLGSYVRVMNAANGRTVEVMINDRGPFVEGRIIDLSFAAAEELDMIDAGTSPVVVEVINDDLEYIASPSLARDERSMFRLAEWPAAVLTANWGSRYGDVWIVPAGGRINGTSWYPLGDLRDERRSRRPSESPEDILPPTPLPGHPIPDDTSGTAGSDSEGIFV